jgi:hypothetical protein
LNCDGVPQAPHPLQAAGHGDAIVVTGLTQRKGGHMRQADPIYTSLAENLRTVLALAMELAAMAGAEQDAVRREDLIHRAMCAWRAAAKMRRWPDPQARA